MTSVLKICHIPDPAIIRNYYFPDSCGPHGSCTPDYSRELGYRCQCYPGYVGPKCLSFKKTVTKSVSDVDENDDFTTPEFEGMFQYK